LASRARRIGCVGVRLGCRLSRRYHGLHSSAVRCAGRGVNIVLSDGRAQRVQGKYNSIKRTIGGFAS